MGGESAYVLPRPLRPPGREDEAQNADRLIEEVRRVEVGDPGPDPAGGQRRALFLRVVVGRRRRRRRRRLGVGVRLGLGLAAAGGAPAEGKFASGTRRHARLGQPRVATEANWKIDEKAPVEMMQSLSFTETSVTVTQ